MIPTYQLSVYPYGDYEFSVFNLIRAHYQNTTVSSFFNDLVFKFKCLFLSAVNVKELEAVVISPSGTSEPCEVADIGNNEYSIKFVPKEIGVHTVSVKHRGIHIPGSPFQFTVGPITEGGAHKVRAHGPGLERGEILVPCKFFLNDW